MKTKTVRFQKTKRLFRSIKRKMKKFAVGAIVGASLLMPTTSLAKPKPIVDLTAGIGYLETDAGELTASTRLLVRLGLRTPLLIEDGHVLKFAATIGGFVNTDSQVGLEEAKLALRYDYDLLSIRAFVLNSQHFGAVLAPGGVVCVGPVCAGGRYEVATKDIKIGEGEDAIVKEIAAGPNLVFVNGTIPIVEDVLSVQPQLMYLWLPNGLETQGARVAISVRATDDITVDLASILIAKPEFEGILKTDTTMSLSVVF